MIPQEYTCVIQFPHACNLLESSRALRSCCCCRLTVSVTGVPAQEQRGMVHLFVGWSVLQVDCKGIGEGAFCRGGVY